MGDESQPHTMPQTARFSSIELADGLLWRLAQETEGMALSTTGELEILEQKLSTSLSILRSLRNISSSPIHRLPTEILSSIFHKLQDLSTPSSYLPQLPQSQYPYSESSYNHNYAYNPNNPNPITLTANNIHTMGYPLQPITLVCRRWREIALALPTLWSNIFYADDKLVSTCIKRSNPTPLNVYIQPSSIWPLINPPDTNTDTFGTTTGGPGTGTGSTSQDLPTTHDTLIIQSLTPHIHRIRQLHLLDISSSAITTTSLLSHPAPLLESLTISIGYPSFPLQPIPITPPILQTLFSQHSPNLRKVALHGFTSWSPNIFTDLTHLTLSHQDPSLPISLSNFISSLSSCPLLQDLAIVRPVFTFDGTTASPPIPLSQLHTLSLGSWNASHHISQFISSLSLPPTVHIFIWGARSFPTETLSDICPFQPHLLASMNITQLRITHNPDRQLGSLDLGWGNEDSLYNVFLTPTKFQIDGSFPPMNVLLLIPTTFPPLGTITQLWIGCQSFPEIENNQWRDFFSSFPLLQTLVISRRSSQPIISALTLNNEEYDNTNTTSPTLLCPDLTTLRLYSDTSRSVLRLAILAEERLRLGHPIQLLQVIFPPGPSSSSLSRHHSSSSSRRARSPELISDLMYLQKYIKKVECSQRTDSSGGAVNWELVEEWPPTVFDWVPGERR